MKRSLRALLAESIDYAGLFPPAKLPLEEAVDNYARYRQQHNAWMLARFVCPAGLLGALDPLRAGQFEPQAIWRIAALGEISELTGALQSIASACANPVKRASIGVLETRLPADLLASPPLVIHRLDELFNAISELMRTVGVALETIFCESVFTEDWRPTIAAVIETMGLRNGRPVAARGDALEVGFKLRTGGLDAAAFPTSEQVALVIAACRDAGVRWKATAGLHQPLTHTDAALGARAFGFVNLLGATALAAAHQLTAEQLVPILECEQPADLEFGDEEFAWRGMTVSTGQIVAARQSALVSFGSCSFDEPREGLQALGWL